MNTVLQENFDEVWLIDFEFSQPPGELPNVVCMVAISLFTGRRICMSQSELSAAETPPFEVNDRTLFVAYFSSAEWSCFMALDWPLPIRVLDLFVEYKVAMGGLKPRVNFSLLGALVQYNLDGIAPEEKDEMRQLAMQGGPYSKEEMSDLLAYCTSDVEALQALLLQMLPNIDLRRALLRGRFMVAVARMERTGVPIDVDLLEKFRLDRSKILNLVVRRIDHRYGVYDGTTFKESKFEDWLTSQEIFDWPRLVSGRLQLDTETFKAQSQRYPQVAALAELRRTMSSMANEKLTYGSDGRNRCMLSPFRSTTGRNQPSNSKFIFGLPGWFRSFIKPKRALAYIDWSNQELGIAAALSGDQNMIAAYNSGDPYLAFAKLSGAVPESATKASHPHERERYKVCSLGVQYGMTERGLSAKLGISTAEARQLLACHRRAYPKFWEWTQANIDEAAFTGTVQSVFGWRYRVGEKLKPRTVANFPCQANGAEMLRLACCLTTEADVTVCCPVHDALLIEAAVEDIEAEVARTRSFMAEASSLVLDGFELRTDVDYVLPPDRYEDGRGKEIWNMVMDYVDRPTSGEVV